MSAISKSSLDGSWVVEDQNQDSLSEGDSSDRADTTQSPRMTRVQKDSSSERPFVAPRSKPYKQTRSIPTEPEFIMPSPSTTTVLPVADRLVKKRKGKGASLPSSQEHLHKQPSGVSPAQDVPQETVASRVLDQMVLILGHAAEWTLDIMGQTLKALKKPISWVLAAYLFAGMLMFLQNLLTASIYTALSPICRIPGISLFHLPICQYASSDPNAPTLDAGSSAPVEFDALMKTQSHFEEILFESAAGITLPLDMKRSETSIRDLRQIVRYSQLPSRNELTLEFDGFIETARIASYDLQKFNSHVGRGVDIVLSTARWTQRVLDDMATKKSSRGVVPSFIQDRLLAPFKPVEFSESRLLDQYITHTRVIGDEIERLIEEAQALLLVLQNLEDRLEVIHGVSMRDNIAAQAGKDEILGHLWTLLGGNRGKLGKYNKQLMLLREVGQYRKIAYAHVSATILKLQAMGAELEELRTRVASAEVLQHHREIPLSVHVESIRLGVERLQEGRERARRIEQSHVRRIVDGVEPEPVMPRLGEA
ncbi:hypothetical protein HRR83_005670 [Exophiala dermatitidis]|uniref:Uncharacterized protein n=2 Tax=Exophiala dermatitidis TaxID=5970 RepID=H6BVL5_EXODN|nr:uncharacterized protein HMPREF1120_03230 [Exophiala dermatitidis NIH/UT8656]KAJ4508059.1 hypothetical protein HRR73_007497 [Exophiala dermatitidis]EHY55074.1 hypothetical protein HMPREF1120_03230 [Exophiala dermatitidis NIH/UT8656]KAJ4510836.1 hypothetical protein HRR75_005530 [Exophiala dermatitidis]KAJ4513226.1 hypothetical protein HRR74_006038 [Exophiala dermatitidis]KAJ4532008.1 hypothetical protein HRR77_008970 [Exophiala dermatitidis]